MSQLTDFEPISAVSRTNMRTRLTHVAAYGAALLAASIVGGGLASAQAYAQDTERAAAPAGAKAVALDSKIQVERKSTDANGKETTELLDPNAVTVVPGDALLFTLSYSNTGATPATKFVAVNPVNKAVRLTGVTEDWAEVSVDGGTTYGKLSDLTVMADVAAPGPDAADPVGDEVGADAPKVAVTPAPRAATYGDVTHIRWTFPEAIPADGKGTLSFRGVVK